MFLPYDRRTRSTGFACGTVHRDFLCHFSRAARRQICKQMQRLQMLQQNNKRNNKQGSSTTANKKRPDVLSSERFPHQRNNPRLRNHPFHTLQATPIAAAHDIRKISLLSEDSKSTLPDSPCFPSGFRGLFRIFCLPAGDATFHTLVADDLRIKPCLAEDRGRRATFGIPAHAVVTKLLGVANTVLGDRFHGIQRPEILTGLSGERNSWHCTLLTFPVLAAYLTPPMISHRKGDPSFTEAP